MRPITLIAGAVAAILLAGSAGGGVAGEARDVTVTPVGSAATAAFAEIGRKGLAVVVVDGGRSLVVPGHLRGKPVKGAALVQAVADFHGLKVAWSGNGATAVLYPGAVEGAAPVVNSAEAAWRAGWFRDARVIPALVAAARDKDAEIAWQASRALQRLGWAAALALGGEAAWDWKVAAADRAAYRGASRSATKGPDYLAFLQAAGECGRITGRNPREFLGQALGHWHKSARGYAVLAIGRLPASEASTLLNKALADRSREVREHAAEAAGRLSAMPALETLVADPSLSIRYRAVDALGMVGGDKASALLESALTDPDPVLRRHALSALTAIGGDRAFRIAGELAANKENDLALRGHAISCLGIVGGEKALGLLGNLPAESNVNIRYAAVSALGRTGAGALPLLAKASEDPDARVGMRAIASIGMVGGPGAVKLLEKALGDADEYMRAAAAEALGEVGGDAVLPFLRKALADPDSRVRAAAATALGRSGTAGALALLEGALGDREIGVRADAAAALAGFNAADEKVWALLGKALTDGDLYVCRKAIFTAVSLGGPKALDGLKKALGHSDRGVRAAAAAAMGLAGGPAALPVLEPFLADADIEMRVAAVTALGEIGGAGALEQIKNLVVEHMGWPDPKKRPEAEQARILRVAVNATIRVGGGKALAILENGLNACWSPYRQMFMEAIGEPGGCDGNTALAALEKSLAPERGRPYHDPHAELVAMSRVRGADRARVMGYLEKFVADRADDPSGCVRAVAAMALGNLGGEGVAELLDKAYELSAKAPPGALRPDTRAIVAAAGEVEVVQILRKMAKAALPPNRGMGEEFGTAAVSALADFAGEEDLGLLAEALAIPYNSDGTNNLTYAAANALGKMGGAKARDALLGGLRNPNPKVKVNDRVKACIIATLKAYFPSDPEAVKVVKAAAAN